MKRYTIYCCHYDKSGQKEDHFQLMLPIDVAVSLFLSVLVKFIAIIAVCMLECFVRRILNKQLKKIVKKQMETNHPPLD
jgi:hypothetical protein